MTQKFSDELLNAYLDNQLDKQECYRIMEAIPADKELSDRLCKLQKVKDMVQLAYHHDYVKQKVPPAKKTDRAWPAIAASVFLFIGLLSGWFAHDNINHHPKLTELADSIRINDMARQDEWRLMLHINSNDPKRFEVMIDETEQLLKSSVDNHKKVKIEILTNGPGLSLLKAGDEKYVERLRQLANEYDNLSLLACQRAITRLKVEKGIDIRLVPEAQVVESAMHQVIKRQREGWSYLRI